MENNIETNNNKESSKEEIAESLTETYNSIEESFQQFIFLLFIPNSFTGRVTVYIDEGEHKVSYSIKDFLSKIKKICGTNEMNRLAIACNNIGIPFFYDREKKILKEVKEKPKADAMSVKKIRELDAIQNGQQQNQYNIDNVFNSIKDQYKGLVDNLTEQ